MHQPKNQWIWLPSWKAGDEAEPALVCFRREMYLKEVPASFRIQISADTRYKLYLNQKLCETGPAKGDREIWFYDEIDVSPWLKKGKNIWAVEVLRYPMDNRKSNMSLFRSFTPGLHIISLETDKNGRPLWKTDKNWKVKKAEGFHIVSENPYFAPLQIYERDHASADFFGWMGEEYSDASWENAMEYTIYTMPGNASPGNLKARTIPFMKKIPRRFVRVSRSADSVIGLSAWEVFLKYQAPLAIPPRTREIIDLDAGELMCGFLRLSLSGGTGAQICLLQAECYVQEIPEANSYDDLPVKGDRTDSAKGLLAGNSDFFEPCGLGTAEKPELFTPFWFRTFRFIRIEITTAGFPLTLQDFSYLETGYPLKVRTHVETSDASLKAVWEISERSLKRCMHETYVDCPFYEQLQYAMDARSQILYTYAVSADDRLARRCISDFRRAQKYNGLLLSSYPNVGDGVIPGFSVFYIAMLYDHMMYFGDKTLIRHHILAVDGILEYFHRHRDKRGLVKKIGDVNLPDRYWSFIDWTPQWSDTNGVPSATKQGPVTMESLLYILGLLYAEALNRYIGRTQSAALYEARRRDVQRAVNTCCRGKDGMYTDGPALEQYSQHCQVFAVLTGTAATEEGKKYLLETLEHPQDYAQCSVAMMYYLFRALEKCGLYEQTGRLWDVWRNMVKNHLSTCAEDSLKSRSDCHAWGALILYELPSVILGVRPGAPGYEKIEVKPLAGNLSWAKGEVITPRGIVRAEWHKEGDKLVTKAELPDRSDSEPEFRTKIS